MGVMRDDQKSMEFSATLSHHGLLHGFPISYACLPFSCSDWKLRILGNEIFFFLRVLIKAGDRTALVLLNYSSSVMNNAYDDYAYATQKPIIALCAEDDGLPKEF